MSFGVSGIGDGIALFQLIYDTVEFTKDYRRRNAIHERMLKRTQDYLKFVNELNDEYTHRQPDANNRLILDDIRCIQDAFKGFHIWLEEVQPYLHPPPHQSSCKRFKNTAHRLDFVRKQQKKLEDFDKNLDWELLNARIARSERLKDSDHRATTLGNQMKLMNLNRQNLTNTEDIRATTRNIQGLTAEVLIREDTSLDLNKQTLAVLQDIRDKQAHNDENIRAALTLAKETRSFLQSNAALHAKALQEPQEAKAMLEMNAHRVAALVPPSRALPIETSFGQILKLGLKNTLGLPTNITNFHAVKHLKGLLSSRIIPPSIGKPYEELPQEPGSSYSQPARQCLRQSTAQIHNDSSGLSDCHDWDFIANDDVHATTSWSEGSSTTFAQRRLVINRHFNTSEAIQQGIDIEASATQGYSINAKAYLEAVKIEYIKNLKDDIYIGPEDDYKLRSPKLQSHGITNVTTSESLSRIVKNSAFVDCAFNEHLRSCASLNDDRLGTPTCKQLHPWGAAVLEGKWEVLLHMMVADYKSADFYENIHAALQASHKRYSRDSVESIIYFALNKAPSKPEAYQNTVDEALINATRRKQKEFTEILLFVGANPFAKLPHRRKTTAFEAAVELNALNGMQEWIELFLITAWDRHLLEVASCQRLFELLDHGENDYTEKELDRAYIDITTSVSKRADLDMPYWLTNLLPRRSFVYYEFWSRYVQKYHLRKPQDLKIDIAGIISLNETTQRNPGLLFRNPELQFSWKLHPGWFVGELKHLQAYSSNPGWLSSVSQPHRELSISTSKGQEEWVFPIEESALDADLVFTIYPPSSHVQHPLNLDYDLTCI